MIKINPGSRSDAFFLNPDAQLWPHVQGLVRSINFAKRGLSPPTKVYQELGSSIWPLFSTMCQRGVLKKSVFLGRGVGIIRHLFRDGSNSIDFFLTFPLPTVLKSVLNLSNKASYCQFSHFHPIFPLFYPFFKFLEGELSRNFCV